MRRVESVIDTWYDSGAMPFAQFHYPFEGQEEFAERFPADYICEAQDQTRGWFYTLLAESTLLFGTSSYRNCVCLGLILDPEGQKMSKSRGNVVDPWEVLANHGADAFRWYYLTTQQPWAGYRFSLETVGESVRQFMLTLWNTYSFWVLYANAEGLSPNDLADCSFWSSDDQKEQLELTAADRWVLSRLQTTIGTVRDRTVGSSRPGWLEVRISRVPRGGSSSSLRSAFAASWLASCVTISSASPITKTCSSPMDGRDCARRRIVCTAAR